MKIALFFLITLLTALAQSLIFDFNLLMLLVLVFAFVWSPLWAFSAAFLAGFLLDLFAGQQLGYSSLGFLLPTLLVVFYRQGFSFRNPGIIFIATLVFDFFFTRVTGAKMDIPQGLLLALVMVVFRLVAPPLFESPERGQLKV